jgi:hypothetical protein
MAYLTNLQNWWFISCLTCWLIKLPDKRSSLNSTQSFSCFRMSHYFRTWKFAILLMKPSTGVILTVPASLYHHDILPYDVFQHTVPSISFSEVTPPFERCKERCTIRSSTPLTQCTEVLLLNNVGRPCNYYYCTTPTKEEMHLSEHRLCQYKYSFCFRFFLLMCFK